MNVTRRTFTKQLLAAGSAYTVTQSSSVLARPASALEKLNIGVIGVGGRGAKNLREVSSQNIVALCDVDETRLNQAASEYPAAKKYFDFRKLLGRGHFCFRLALLHLSIRLLVLHCVVDSKPLPAAPSTCTNAALMLADASVEVPLFGAERWRLPLYLRLRSRRHLQMGEL